MSLFSITSIIVIIDHILDFCARVIISKQIKRAFNGLVELLHNLVVGSERLRVVWQYFLSCWHCHVCCFVLRLAAICSIGGILPVAACVLS